MPARCFLAITLPRPAVETLLRAAARFRDDAPHWAGEKWVAPSALHVTLAFLGLLDDGTVAESIRLFTEAASGVEPFELALDGVSALPTTARASMLWARLRDERGACAGLRDAVTPAFDGLHLDVARPFKAHVTLARSRSPRGVPREALATADALVRAAGKEPDGRVSVRSVTLFSSTLHPTGPEYREMAVAYLAGTDCDRAGND